MVLSKAELNMGTLMTYSYIPLIAAAMDKKKSETKDALTTIAVFSFLSYIPGVNLIIGIARAIFLSVNKKFKDKESKDFQAMLPSQRVRAGLECAMIFGPILLISDFLNTGFFFLKAASEKSKKGH